MGQDPLSRIASVIGVLAVGVAAEVAAPGSPGLRAADFVAGAGLGCGGAWLLGRAQRSGALGLAVAIIWFLGTFDGSRSSALSAVGAACLLAYRGPLLHLLLGMPSSRLGSRPMQALAAAGWVGAVLPLSVARPATIVVAGLVAVTATLGVRHAAVDRRAPLGAAACSAGALAVVWGLAALGIGSERGLLLLNDAVVLGAGAVALTAAAGLWAGDAARAMVVELGPTRRPGRPLTARLSRALADPELEVLYALSDVDWVDEGGRAAAVPGSDGRAVTRATAPEGGEVALVHGASTVADPRLVKAAAAAAALALDAAQLEAEVLVRAAEVRASRVRILDVADAERRSLEQRLSDGVLGRLRRVERLLGSGDDATEAERAELQAATDELLALSRGLYPPAIARADLLRALEEMAGRSPVPAVVQAVGSLAELPETLGAAIWFVCSEALANAARHAQASEATVLVRVDEWNVELEVRDDGRGGATPTRGLRGLADRVDALGGTFALSSPAGGPTVLSVQLPLYAGR